jgi:hypothetical protein
VAQHRALGGLWCRGAQGIRVSSEGVEQAGAGQINGYEGGG